MSEKKYWVVDVLPFHPSVMRSPRQVQVMKSLVCRVHTLRRLTYLSGVDWVFGDLVRVPYGPIERIGVVVGSAEDADVEPLVAEGVVFKDIVEGLGINVA